MLVSNSKIILDQITMDFSLPAMVEVFLTTQIMIISSLMGQGTVEVAI